MSHRSNEHLSAERLQAFLDAALPKRERSGAEEHLAVCARCSEELDGWRALFEDLGALPAHGPTSGFHDRVMASVEVRKHLSLSERLRRRLLAVYSSARPAHPSGERLQDFLDGTLPERIVAGVSSHLEGCTTCASEVEAWRAVYARLDGVDRFAPREGFADRVMVAVRQRAASPVATVAAIKAARPAATRLPDWRRALVAVGRFVPRTRRAWATLSGIALTPAVTVGLVLFTVFSHPTLTPQALVSFAAWKLADLFAAGWSALAAFALDNAQVLGMDALVGALFDAPFMLAGGALAYSIVSALALRVLYKNLLDGRRHARVSHS